MQISQKSGFQQIKEISPKSQISKKREMRYSLDIQEPNSQPDTHLAH
jgi:hypothetical protein